MVIDSQFLQFFPFGASLGRRPKETPVTPLTTVVPGYKLTVG
jgi:hypothetical protein